MGIYLSRYSFSFLDNTTIHCMPGISLPSPSVCARCLRVRLIPSTSRYASDTTTPPKPSGKNGEDGPSEDKPQGAMFRKLQEMTEESIQTGGRSARRAVEEGGYHFSESLKEELEAKIASANFRNENASALAEAELPASTAKHIRETAAARPWTGTETVEDASMRMLNDSYKPLRGAAKGSTSRSPPKKVDTGRPKQKPGAGARLANARDRSSLYSYANEQEQSRLTDEERESFRREMKARFSPGARQVAISISGIQSLAEERIQDAIGRGQFKNLPRGRPLERDHLANSPFINTTEYFLNKMIKKQDIVPPWIEKQQEVMSTANIFRKRLRNDWKRHVSRIIASRGGSLESQMKLAEEYALAESIENPSKKQVETVNTVDAKGHMSEITISGELKARTPDDPDDPAVLEEQIKVMEQTFNDDGTLKATNREVIVDTEQPLVIQASPPPTPRKPTVSAFRDPQWMATERSYHELAIKSLNELLRSYNLMAPDSAKKPYFDLDRELRACFADVAPSVAAAIREKALAPKIRGVEVIGHTPGSVLNKFSMDKASHVYDERKPQYGWKEFWRDLFAPKQ
ncbi:hypothetical protein TI39_contig419g00001 [Zymoseptoria brevis]|uniref:DnaJ homologue subfamily C member 28 conserved domain-containing protein n=1 Tax=Zymoseptoria brevis TaxID=1047168 RepID=A0A0F4GLK7_9PEZI|nr:hypothetical protein TI39_contig419g00001 [Zymoseptoria brevis]